MEWLLGGILGFFLFNFYQKSQIAKGNAPSPIPSSGVPALPPGTAPPSAAHPSGVLTPFIQTPQGVKLSDPARRILAPLLQNFVITDVGAFPGEFRISRPISLTGLSVAPTPVSSVLQTQLGFDVWIQSDILDIAVGGGAQATTIQFEFRNLLPQKFLNSSLSTAKSVSEAETNKTVLVLLRTADETGAAS